MNNIIFNANYIKTDNKQSRIIEIDYIKALAIFLVVLGHLLETFQSSYSGILYKLIYLFHIPLFVFISGYLSKFRTKDLTRFCLIYLTSFLAYSLFNHILLGTALCPNFLYPYWLLWYLMSLLAWKISLPILDQIPQKYYTLAIILLFLFGLFIGNNGTVNSFFSMSRTLAFYPFFVLGYFNRKSNTFGFNIKLKNITKIALLIITFVLFRIMFNYVPFANAAFYMSGAYRGETNNSMQRMIIYLFALVIVVLITSIKISKKNKLIEAISKHTLTIYLLHGFVIVVMKNFCRLQNRNLSILISILIAILLVLIFTLVGILVSKLKVVLKNKMSKSKLNKT